jgi:uncharacterized protein YndB with AHSA1/START domain
MTNEKKDTISVSRVIAAPPESIFAILKDARRHQEIDGSGQIKGTVDAPESLELGSKFAMTIQQGVPYRTYSKVIEFDENKTIAWTHIGKHIWKYELKDQGDRTTLVTESWDWSTCPPWERAGLQLMKYPSRNAQSMTKTLERLATIVE